MEFKNIIPKWIHLKKIAILQSNYIPWKGYFDIIGKVDEFILYDEVQYTKNDWRNRNKIKTPIGAQWLTIPVFQKNLQQKISETQVCHKNWGIKNWSTIKSNYSRAPHFKEFSPVFENFYHTFTSTYLSDINKNLILLICSFLGIKTVITSAHDYEFSGNPTEKLVQLCKKTNADIYLSGPSAKNYIDESLFSDEHIKIEWMDYSSYPEYPQLFPPFTHEVSIIDLLFNMGQDSKCFMKCFKI